MTIKYIYSPLLNVGTFSIFVFSNVTRTHFSSSTLFYKTHIPHLNSITVVGRCSVGSPLISLCFLCLLSRPALHAEPIFNMTAHPGSLSNNKLYLQLSAGPNHWGYQSTKCWIPVNIPAGGKKANRPTEIHISHSATETSFGVHNLIFITCKYDTEVKKGKNKPQPQ